MSGIAGIYYLDGRPIEGEVLARMAGVLAHRGVDGSYTYTSGSVGLAFLAHWTGKEPADQELPVRSKDGAVVITADVRLDNREDLAGELGLSAAAVSEASDEELLLEAYLRWGERCPEKLLGDFAFALWDERGQRLFCARDSLGSKPLYYYHREGALFLFASEIKVLLCHPETPRKVNEFRIADYLAMNFEDKSGTFYHGIYRLPPGCCMTVDPRGAKKRIYWSLDPDMNLRLKTDQEYSDAFREIFFETLRCRLRSSRSVGFLLSGGLDSSSLVCAARQFSASDPGSDLIAFSAVFPTLPRLDEQSYIDTLMEMGGIESIRVRADDISPLTDIERVYKHQDEPFHAPNLFIFWALAQAARKRGVHVLLDGIDGDTTVSHGFDYLAELLRRGRWLRFAQEVNWLSRRFAAPRWRFLWHYGLQPTVIAPMCNLFSSLRGQNWIRTILFAPIINPQFAQRLGLEDRYRILLQEKIRKPRTHKEIHWNHLTSGLIPFTLEVNDKAGAAFGLESRHPFFDRRLIEFCYAIPPEQRLNKGWDRVIQRRAVEGLVPKNIQWRIRKSQWGPNFKQGLFSGDKEIVEEVVFRKADLLSSYVDTVALRGAYERCQGNEVSLTDGMNIWLAVTLGLWLGKSGLNA